MRLWLPFFILSASFFRIEALTFPIPPLAYESLPLTELISIKRVQDPPFAREVFQSADGQFFVKLWEASYPNAPHFIRACDKDFYAEIAPPFLPIVNHMGACVGYITKPCPPSPYRLQTETNAQGYVRLQNSSFQNSPFQHFYHTLLEHSLTYHLYYLDLVPSNLYFIDGHYALVDLEPLYTAEELREFKQTRTSYFNFVLDTLPPDYAYFLENVLNGDAHD